MSGPKRRWGVPLAIFIVCSGIYCATAADRLSRPSANNHYVHLADTWLHGRLDLGASAPGTNDWACFDTLEQGPCPEERYSFPSGEDGRYRWYVSFPPLPAILLLPFVAIFGLGTWDALFWAVFAGLAPMLLFVVLRFLREDGRSSRTERDDLLVTGLYAFGSVYYFVAVQGTVWFAAHVAASAFVCVYLLASFGGRRPLLAGVALGLAFLCRPTTALLGLFFVVEAWHSTERGSRLRRLVAFVAPLCILLFLAMGHNVVRFGDPLEFGHRFLQVRWRSRIETWGLFSFHYLPRNLTVFLFSIPWWLAESPFVRISRHGLALWLTTPNLLWSLFPKKLDTTIAALWVAVLATATCTLLYQNTGWIQFGYRFSLDYLPLLFVLIALGGRRFGRAFWTCACFSLILNTFGAVTFDRFHRFYDTDPTQTVIFQPE